MMDTLCIWVLLIILSFLQMKHVKIHQNMYHVHVEGRDSDDWMAVDLGKYSVSVSSAVWLVFLVAYIFYM